MTVYGFACTKTHTHVDVISNRLILIKVIAVKSYECRWGSQARYYYQFIMLEQMTESI